MLAPLLPIGLALVLRPQIEYELRPSRASDAWTVEARLANPSGEDLTYCFPRWVPGGTLREYGGAVREVGATDGRGRELEVRPIYDCMHRVVAEGATEIVVRYEVPAHSAREPGATLDAEENGIGRGFGFVEPGSLLGYVHHRTAEPVRLTLRLPSGWEAATALASAGRDVYRASSYLELVDSPVLFAAKLRTARLDVEGVDLRVSYLGWSRARTDEVVETCRALMRGAARVLGEAPFETFNVLLVNTPFGGSSRAHASSALVLLHSGELLSDPRVLRLLARRLVEAWCAGHVRREALREPDMIYPPQVESWWIDSDVPDYLALHVLLHARYLDRAGLLEGLHPYRSPVTEKQYAGGPGRETRAIFALDVELRRASGAELGLADLLLHLARTCAGRTAGLEEDEPLRVASELLGTDPSPFFTRHVVAGEPVDMAHALEVLGYDWQDFEATPSATPTEAQLAAREAFFRGRR